MFPHTNGAGYEDHVYCTQPAPPGTITNNVVIVTKSPNSTAAQSIDVACVQADEMEAHSLDGTCTMDGSGGTIGHDTGAVVDNDDDVWSQPKAPCLGMRFDTLEGAKEHCNAYALQPWFSIKMNTSRRSTLTGQLEKYNLFATSFGSLKVMMEVHKLLLSLMCLKMTVERQNMMEKTPPLPLSIMNLTIRIKTRNGNTGE